MADDGVCVRGMYVCVSCYIYILYVDVCVCVREKETKILFISFILRVSSV